MIDNQPFYGQRHNLGSFYGIEAIIMSNDQAFVHLFIELYFFAFYFTFKGTIKVLSMGRKISSSVKNGFSFLIIPLQISFT